MQYIVAALAVFGWWWFTSDRSGSKENGGGRRIAMSSSGHVTKVDDCDLPHFTFSRTLSPDVALNVGIFDVTVEHGDDDSIEVSCDCTQETWNSLKSQFESFDRSLKLVFPATAPYACYGERRIKLKLSHLSKYVHVVTTWGDVHISGIHSPIDIMVNSDGGNVVLRDLRIMSGTVRVATTSGDVNMDSVDALSQDVRTINGDISLYRCSASYYIHAISRSGDICFLYCRSNTAKLLTDRGNVTAQHCTGSGQVQGGAFLLHNAPGYLRS
jgi:hypothetical protein